MNLACWESHKIVNAGKIKWLDSRMTAGCSIVVTDADGASLTVVPHADFWNRVEASERKPQIGDYFVLYTDNYQSWSPAKAFEEGYTRIA